MEKKQTSEAFMLGLYLTLLIPFVVFSIADAQSRAEKEMMEPLIDLVAKQQEAIDRVACQTEINALKLAELKDWTGSMRSAPTPCNPLAL